MAQGYAARRVCLSEKSCLRTEFALNLLCTLNRAYASNLMY